jgi:hypothetical protein
VYPSKQVSTTGEESLASREVRSGPDLSSIISTSWSFVSSRWERCCTVDMLCVLDLVEEAWNQEDIWHLETPMNRSRTMATLLYELATSRARLMWRIIGRVCSADRPGPMSPSQPKSRCPAIVSRHPNKVAPPPLLGLLSLRLLPRSAS